MQSTCAIDDATDYYVRKNITSSNLNLQQDEFGLKLIKFIVKHFFRFENVQSLIPPPTQSFRNFVKSALGFANMKTIRANSVFMIRLAGCPVHFYLLTMNKMDNISFDFYLLKDMPVYCTMYIKFLSTMNMIRCRGCILHA